MFAHIVPIFKVRALADRHGLSVHTDGARLMNAAVALGLPAATILQYTDSVTVSLSKVGRHTKTKGVRERERQNERENY